MNIIILGDKNNKGKLTQVLFILTNPLKNYQGSPSRYAMEL